MIENMERILRLPEILEITGVSNATIWRWVNSGDFPAPVKLGGPPDALDWLALQRGAGVAGHQTALRRTVSLGK